MLCTTYEQVEMAFKLYMRLIMDAMQKGLIISVDMNEVYIVNNEVMINTQNMIVKRCDIFGVENYAQLLSLPHNEYITSNDTFISSVEIAQGIRHNMTYSLAYQILNMYNNILQHPLRDICISLIH